MALGSVPLIHVSVFVPVPYSFDYCSFVVQVGIREHDTSSSLFLSQDCFDYLRSLKFHTNFIIICFSSVKNTLDILILIALNL